MNLSLTIPELMQDSGAEVPTQPSSLKQWLESLPLLNTAETGRQVHKALMLTNRLELEQETRLELLELYREPVELIANELRKQYTGLSLPLSEKNRLIADQVKHFQIEMAYGYKRFLLDIDRTSKAAEKQGVKLATPIQRAIRYLTGVLVHAYQFYTPYPAGTLREIHELFRYAEKLGLVDTPVPDTLNDTIGQSSVSHAYKQALLLDLSDPYHLPAHMIGKIQRYLDRWAPLASITGVTAEPDPRCQFLIDLQSDRAGYAYLGGSRIREPEHFRLLTTLELVRVAHEQLSLTQQGSTPAHKGLGEGFFGHNARDMLLRLINVWGVNPKRVFPRKTQSGGQVEAVIGLAAINYYINGERRFLTSAKRMGPMPPQHKAGTLFGASQPDRAARGDYEEKRLEDKIGPHRCTLWEFVDESAGGLALERRRSNEIDIKVGDLIATRIAGQSGEWIIAVVRWMKYPGSDRTEIGAQRLAPKATPVAIKTLDKDGKESDFMYALMVPELKALKQARTLIAPRGVFNPDHPVYLDDGELLRRVTATKLVEVTGVFERFEYRFTDF